MVISRRLRAPGGGPGGEQARQARVRDLVGVRVEVVLEVVQHEQDRHLVEDVVVQQGEPVGPRHLDARRDLHRDRRRTRRHCSSQQLASGYGRHLGQDRVGSDRTVQ
ncbi:hypothetical protein GCM10022255_037990 [Dactylosporangium darangshiense]|uniref:Uncharacterized protein n=1 Tax=Dactylosporangium darangshiense TaxID=579108 RepID=A0ABP8D9C1_9ACTN